MERHARPQAEYRPAAVTLLEEQFPGPVITPATILEQDLAIDSMDWLELVLEVRRRLGVDLDGPAISRIKSARDLIHEIAAARPLERGLCSSLSPLDAPEAFLGQQGRHWLDPLGSTELAGGWCVYVLNWLLVRPAFRLRIRGREQLPTKGPFVITPHHESYLDSFVLAATLSFPLLRNTYWAAWTGVAFSPTFRLLRRLTHILPVDSSWGAASSLAYGAAVLRRRQNLVWFPEGMLSRSAGLLDLKPGIGLLLAHYPVPVVPVHLRGTSAALPPGRKVPRPGPVEVVFGAQLDPRDYIVSGDSCRSQERIIRALHEALERLQEA
jgi:long-chain acyl-CoA synthetase